MGGWKIWSGIHFELGIIEYFAFELNQHNFQAREMENEMKSLFSSLLR